MGHEDFCELEERLADTLMKNALREWQRAVETGEVYRGVEEYDPVLRSHCRLEG